MIDDIKRAIDGYKGLSPLGKRFFREDVGLASVKARGTRRKTMRKTTGRVRAKKGETGTGAGTVGETQS